MRHAAAAPPGERTSLSGNSSGRQRGKILNSGKGKMDLVATEAFMALEPLCRKAYSSSWANLHFDFRTGVRD